MTLPILTDGAVCAQVDPELWFPPKGASAAVPKRLCGSCPLIAACRAWALDHPRETEFGVWGGTTPRERRELRTARRTAAATAPARLDGAA